MILLVRRFIGLVMPLRKQFRMSGIMIGKPENKICPLCGGSLELGLANIPFVFGDSVIVVKAVPAEICTDCHEPFVAGRATDRVMFLLNQLKAMQSEVSIVTYSEPVAV